MMTKLEQAFPLNANWVAATVRAKLAEMGVYFSTTAALTGENFSIQPFAAIAIYGEDGDLTFYAHDAADTTTADDGGLTTIVVSGRRYKRASEVVLRDAALSATTVAQPASPAPGDCYILTAAPTGTDWASKAKNVATYTAGGWAFRAPFVGQVAYVADEATFYHYAAGGTWTAGLGPGSLADGAIAPKKLAQPFGRFVVEDARNAPPGSAPTAGTCYQVGTSPTGDFAGQANAVARWTGAAYEFFAPFEGATIYRKDVSVDYTYRSGVWGVTVAPAGVQTVKSAAQASETKSAVGSTRQLYSTVLSIASVAGRRLRATLFQFQSDVSGTGTANLHSYEIGIYRDSESTPLEVVAEFSVTNDAGGITYADGVTKGPFLLPVADGASHDYALGVRRTAGPSTFYSVAVAAGDFMIEEIVLA